MKPTLNVSAADAPSAIDASPAATASFVAWEPFIESPPGGFSDTGIIEPDGMPRD